MKRAGAARAGAIVGALALAVAAALVSAPPALADPAFRVISSAQFGPNSSGDAWIVGEVENVGTDTAQDIEITIDLKDESGQLLGKASSFTPVAKLAPGERSPFRVFVGPPSGYARYDVTVRAVASPEPPNHNFALTVTNSFVDEFGRRHLVGRVTNNNTTTARSVQVVSTYYNAAGTAVAVAVGPAGPGELTPGQTGSWALELAADEPAFASYALVAESVDAPAIASPSPSATAATPTPSPSPSGPPQAPTFIAPTTATAGVLITVYGSAAPGAVVELWGVTAPNATITRVNTPTVTADENGKWAKVIRPLRNVNLQARVGQARSATQFIAVKTSVSQSVAPLAGCIVQVSGRVFEPKPGRTVYVRAGTSTGTVLLGTGTVQTDGRFLLRKRYTCGHRIHVYTVIEGDAVNRPGAAFGRDVIVGSGG